MKALIFLVIVALAILRPMPHAPQPAAPPPVVLIHPADLDDALNCSLRFGVARVDWTVIR